MLTGPQTVDRPESRVDQDRDGVAAPRGRGRDQGELVAQLTGVLDDADDGPATAVEGQRLSDLEREEVGHTVGDGDLAGALRVAARRSASSALA